MYTKIKTQTETVFKIYIEDNISRFGENMKCQQQSDKQTYLFICIFLWVFLSYIMLFLENNEK